MWALCVPLPRLVLFLDAAGNRGGRSHRVPVDPGDVLDRVLPFWSRYARCANGLEEFAVLVTAAISFCLLSPEL